MTTAAAGVAGAWIDELFSSWQGEGLWLGCRQLFLRFSGCNLRCAYCDTPSALERQPGFRSGAGRRPNPIGVAALLAILEEADLAAHHSVSFTGGEPLLQAECLLPLAAGIKARGGRVYLETNGSLPDALPPLLPHTDFVSMDWKLPSATGADSGCNHAEFLRLCRGKPLQVKVVCAAATGDDEVEAAAAGVAAIGRDIPLVLQPASEPGGGWAVGWGRLAALERICAPHLQEVRIIPQMHRLLNLP